MRILLGSYMVRYPLGGMMSWVLQYLSGLVKLGHDVFFVEKAGYPNSCFDPQTNSMGDDCRYGTRIVAGLLARLGLERKWCYVDAAGAYHGLARAAVEDVFRTADVFLDMGTHGSWLPEAEQTGCRVLIDGEPGFTQMKMAARLARGETLPAYHDYVTTGRNIGTERSSAPSAGQTWRHIWHPVDVEKFPVVSPAAAARVTTVMHWQSYEPLTYEGRVYGHKDVEFDKFFDLPSHVATELEVAVGGPHTPAERLRQAGWHVRDAHHVTRSFDSFVEYVQDSLAEFSVCKNGFVATNSGWFSDRSAAYLASGRPVVMQDTGFSDHLPTGAGLFAVRTVEEAADALDAIRGDYRRHSAAARAVAEEHLQAETVLGELIRDLGG
ncbi:MAG: hypothetical protein KY476_02485 [Planctomycetes bacterium]|nr:hypothetical protein [Planctomycetota bacterium]